MKIISHRGNLYGPSNEENSPDQIYKALLNGFDCEIDVWLVDNKIVLGHDKPEYEVDHNFLNQQGLWLHAKNIEALDYLSNTQFNYFWHQGDKATMTSKGVIWCFPGIFCKNGITVLPNYVEIPQKILGVCTDFPFKFCA